MLEQILGLESCKEYIQMPIQTLDGIHVHEKLLQESFVEQLNSLQTLEQLMPLKAAKEHLPQDIINILELLGKADNIPFNQLCSLAEDCADRYYTKVIKTLTQLLLMQLQ